MKLIHAKHHIRRCWVRHPHARGLVLERDITITRRGRLAAKLLVFRSQRDLVRFWDEALGSSIGPRTCGAVHQLSNEIISPGHPDLSRIEADPRYFCVIGLLRGYLGMEIICHESVHAGYAYAKRAKRTPWNAHAKDFDEEAIAYPAGAIAAAINRALWGGGLFKPEHVGVTA